MRRSLKLLLFGIAVPGALSPAIYAARQHDHQVRTDDVRVQVRHIEHEIEKVEVRVDVDVSPVRVRVAPFSVVSLAFGSADCEVRQERELAVEARRNPTLHVSAGAGALEVVGVEGLDEVRISAVLCASSEELMEDLEVTLSRSGDRIELETEYPSGRSNRNRAYARIDLVVE